MPLKLEILAIFIYLVWLLVLTFFFVRFFLYYSRLLKNGKKESLPALLDGIIEKEEKTDKKIEEISKRCSKLEYESLLHIQKVGLLRFNPFKDTGGDQSFILALLDSHDTGVVVSSLHTRTGTRWYAKRVVKGHGIEYDLSEDEQKVLKESKFLSKD
ncbi:MAG: hypothetical protein A2857_05770 [Candidatus Levybacteria bacterium RIFCSPHIGHO2_01_FULL_36_15]|nr:MAG: hypothetical protein A2857_05770 [Candidatus Levybacteria bacterium RIFCSPHIGHO2_01_FULL_36_15]OGH38404.1 MAG: hypothetical protein A2905_00570 [Candidatus Levybacteria bacterium RIFCSPLOWO2_01_FULL_36_10]